MYRLPDPCLPTAKSASTASSKAYRSIFISLGVCKARDRPNYSAEIGRLWRMHPFLQDVRVIYSAHADCRGSLETINEFEFALYMYPQKRRANEQGHVPNISNTASAANSSLPNFWSHVVQIPCNVFSLSKPLASEQTFWVGPTALTLAINLKFETLLRHCVRDRNMVRYYIVHCAGHDNRHVPARPATHC